MVVLEAAGRKFSSPVVELGLILRPSSKRYGAGEVTALLVLKVVGLVGVLWLRRVKVEPVLGRAKKTLLSSVTHFPSGLMGCALAAPG